MVSTVASGVLRGRPFGGVMTLVHKRLQNCTTVVCAADRYVVVVVGNLLVINVYFPCTGTANRLYICEEMINELMILISKHSYKTVII